MEYSGNVAPRLCGVGLERWCLFFFTEYVVFSPEEGPPSIGFSTPKMRLLKGGNADIRMDECASRETEHGNDFPQTGDADLTQSVYKSLRDAANLSLFLGEDIDPAPEETNECF